MSYLDELAFHADQCQGPEHLHVVKFYENEGALCEVVIPYLVSGIKENEGIVVIATLAHRRAFRRGLESHGIDVSNAEMRGQIVFCDANYGLSQFMEKEVPNSEKLKAWIESLLSRLPLQFVKIRCFGEMVDILLAQGNFLAMLRLEELWNEIIEAYSLKLFCSYRIKNFKTNSSGQQFYNVCETHSNIMLPEKVPAYVEKFESASHVIFAMQKKCKSLQREIVGRIRVEKVLMEALQLRDESWSVASHELRTPLTSLSLQLQMLRRHIAKGEQTEIFFQLKKLADYCDTDVKRIINFVNGILDFTQIQLGRFKLELSEFDLVELTQEVVNRFNNDMRLSRKNGRENFIRVYSRGSIVGKKWDRIRVEQVITNLLTNAIKYGEGKSVEVHLKLNSEKSTVSLSVRDLGIGISLEDQRKLFKRFVRLPSTAHISGMGLGLYIVRQIVDNHGGTIRVESRLNEGSIFTVEFPLDSEKASQRFPLAI